ncbi:MAG: universal stress protein [Deltaproteobacteria bacterium]|nr:universal stress protein [Deltaproteobacteria bacterium]
MSRIKKIMVAIAFSKYSQAILDYGLSMATSLGAEVVVANVIHSRDVEAVGRIQNMGYKVDPDEYIQGVKAERQAVLETMIKDTSFPAEKLKTISKVGHPSDKLIQIIEEEGIDLVVMGAKGRSDLPHALLGSVAQKLFRHSPVPVLSYRDKGQ